MSPRETRVAVPSLTSLRYYGHSMNSQPPNEVVKDLRERLGITTRDVAELSQKIAETQDNPEFQISNAWLTQIENSNSMPSIFKLYSLSAIYRLYRCSLSLRTRPPKTKPPPNHFPFAAHSLDHPRGLRRRPHRFLSRPFRPVL